MEARFICVRGDLVKVDENLTIYLTLHIIYLLLPFQFHYIKILNHSNNKFIKKTPTYTINLLNRHYQ
jgi:hypothetical protein